MALTKKAYFFSLAVLLFLAVLTVFLSSRADPGFTRQSAVHAQRIAEVQSFLDAVERDADTALYVASYRSFLVLDQEVLYKEDKWVNEDDWSASFDDAYEELVLYGTLVGEPIALTDGYDIEQWLENLDSLTQHLRLDLAITGLEVRARQDDPWHVKTSLTGQLRLHDAFTDSVWDYAFAAETDVPVTLLNDPVYTKGTGQRYAQRITMSPHAPEGPVPVSAMQDHIEEPWYVATGEGVGFLDRLQGRFTPSANGIESLVDVRLMQAIGVLREEAASIVDWQYLVLPETADCVLEGVPEPWALVPASRSDDYACSQP
ncbi:hypothetical protein JXA12_00495 [Candidatus Woesearchaeota archaeon]|nr:hypothetical protein [Candidatus Woesearchaeota archaeon]